MAEKYSDIVKKIPILQKALGPLAGIANRLDYIGPKVDESAEKIASMEYAMSQLEVKEGAAMPKTVMEQIPFSYTLAIAGLAGSGVTLVENAPFSGYIKEVSPHWPAGCNAWVDIRVGHGVKQFCPDEGYLALDDATPTYPFNEWVRDREEIWVELRNRDGANPHSITVTVILSGVKP